MENTAEDSNSNLPNNIEIQHKSFAFFSNLSKCQRTEANIDLLHCSVQWCALIKIAVERLALVLSFEVQSISFALKNVRDKKIGKRRGKKWSFNVT